MGDKLIKNYRYKLCEYRFIWFNSRCLYTKVFIDEAELHSYIADEHRNKNYLTPFNTFVSCIQLSIDQWLCVSIYAYAYCVCIVFAYLVAPCFRIVISVCECVWNYTVSICRSLLFLKICFLCCILWLSISWQIMFFLFAQSYLFFYYDFTFD